MTDFIIAARNTLKKRMTSSDIENITTDEYDLPEWFRSALMSPVNLFQLYRLFLSLFILFTFYTQSGPIWLGFFYPGLFATASIIYFSFVITSLIMTKLQTVKQETNVQIMMFTDIIFITLLMHASGGVQTGMGILLAISVTAGSLLMKGKMALLFASFATVAVITQQFTTYLSLLYVSPDFVQAAMLGLAFFAIALLSHSLALHIRASEQLAIRTRQDLNNMAQLNEHVIGQMQEGVIAVDNNLQIKLINNAAKQFLQAGDSINHTNIEEICPEMHDILSRKKLSTKTRSVHTIEFFANQDNRPSQEVRVTLNPLGNHQNQGMLIFMEDLAEISHQAQQMKLASLGRLTASIAHEIRNPLGAISHAGQLLSESETINLGDRRLTEIITNNSHRMNQIIENVLNLSRRDSSEPEMILLNQWLNDTRMKILQSSTLQPTQISIDINPDNLLAWFDPNQLEQALTILIENAISHFDREPGKLNVKLTCFKQDDNTLLQCADNGPGISEEEARKIFEPFFTTRPSGTGLGLYIARELIESNKAQITYTPAHPHGSIFRIFFAKHENLETSQ